MRILIDLQGKQNGSRDRGIGRYSLALARAILRNAKGHQLYVLLNDSFTDTLEPMRKELADLIPVDQILTFSVPRHLNEGDETNTWRARAAELVRERFINELAPDAVLVCSLFEGAGDDTVSSVGLLNTNITTAVILYDLIPFLDPEKYLGGDVWRNWYYKKIDSLRRADVLLAISSSAAREAIEELGVSPAQVVNISSAVDPSFNKTVIDSVQKDKILARYGIKRKFLMHTSALDPRKNFVGLVKSYAALPKHIRKDYQLVLVFKIAKGSDDKKNFEELATSLGLATDELILTDYVSDQDLIKLYTLCHLFVFPSFHEGFGLPILEAMSCGAASIGSNTSSIPEVVGRQDALFDPYSIESMRDLIQRALTDQAFWQSLKEHALVYSKKFSWDESAQVALSALEKNYQKNRADIGKSENCYNGNLDDFISRIARTQSPAGPLEQDYIDLARYIHSNDLVIQKVKATASYSSQLVWRLEGPFDSSYSLALLNRETARAMEQLGHQVVLHSTEGPGDFPPNPQFLEKNKDLAVMNQRVVTHPQYAVHVTSRNLYPPRVEDMHSPLNLLHHYAWEESGFPQEWARNFNIHLDGITCLSKHVEKIMIDNGVTVPMVTSGCGVDHWERIIPSVDYRVNARKFCFLHVSTCLPRKGPEALLDAYGLGFSIHDDVTLIVKTSPNEHNKIHEWIDVRKSNNPNYPHVIVIEDDLSDADIKALYMQSDVLVQPARAEGFGLPMAEAMLSGIPVITTAWSGQLEFCNDQTAWLVDYKFTRAKTHFGLYSSAWAEVDVGDLAQTMRLVQDATTEQRKAKAAAGRKLLLNEYKWIDCTAKALNAAQEWRKNKISTPIPKIGWITTWNTKCGIATYSKHLIDELPDSQNITIFASPLNEPHSDDGPNCFRSWQAGIEGNNLNAVRQLIRTNELNLIVIQFNSYFFIYDDLASFIEDQISEGCVVVIMMHSTDTYPIYTKNLLIALAKCQRILVHSINDLNNLKAVGLVENVCLFPHGVLSDEVSSIPSKPDLKALPLVASYGFCLPLKGLVELVQAVSLLKHKGTPVRLRLVNAEYPIPESADLIKDLKLLVKNFGISDLVEFYNDFLEDDQSLELLREADLLIFPYQRTGESASGAARYGMATKKPVAVTPLKIFDDLGEAVFRFSGTDYVSIADGILTILHETRTDSYHAQHIRKAANRWLEAHNYVGVSQRLHNICVALLRGQSSQTRVYTASNPELKVGVGMVQGRNVVSNGVGGFLIYGPYSTLPRGNYTIKIRGHVAQLGSPPAYVDVVAKNGTLLLALQTVHTATEQGVIAEMEFYTKDPVEHLEARLMISADSALTVSEIEILSQPPTLKMTQTFKRLRYSGADHSLKTEVGQRDEFSLNTTDTAGNLCVGHFSELLAGHHQIRLYGNAAVVGSPAAYIEVSADQALFTSKLKPSSKSGVLAELDIELHHPARNCEVKVWVPKNADIALNMLELSAVPEPKAHCYFGSDTQFGSEVGRREWLSIHTTGSAGYLFFGPYLTLPKGRYQVRIHGQADRLGLPAAYVEAAISKGGVVLGSKFLDTARSEGVLADMIVELSEPVFDFEVRIWVASDADLSISKLEILPIKNLKVEKVPGLKKLWSSFFPKSLS